MHLEIRVDRGRCIGSGQCVFVAGGAFDQDADAKAFVKDPRGEPEERIVHAVTACPVQAISLRVDGTEVGAEDLKDWAHGARSNDPVVAALEQLCEDHHELRLAFTAPETAFEGNERICGLTKDHLSREDEAYSAIAALVDPRLVAAFEADHATIDRAVDDLRDPHIDPRRQEEARSRLAHALSDHIQLEETVLFPAALAALAKR